jgi:hypothetical protein
MIICHAHKFIFIKTMKTAGTSLEIALSKFCGPRDVITPVLPVEDEEIRRSLGYRGPQNYRLSLGEYRLKDWMNYLRGRDGRMKFFNHIGARQIRRLVEPEVWHTYYKFCFERNPWDKAVSMYFWRHQSNGGPSLSEFVQSRQVNALSERGGFDLYSIDGEIVVDRVFQYEAIQKGLQSIAERVGLREVPKLPRAKGSARSDPRHYRELLNAGDREKIARVFAREIAHFGYEF